MSQQLWDIGQACDVMRSYQAVVVLSHSRMEDTFQCMNIDFVISHILSLDWTAALARFLHVSSLCVASYINSYSVHPSTW